MKQVKLQKWIDALRSNEFDQGHYTLYNPSTNKYCALGVLAKITGEQITENQKHLPLRIESYLSDVDYFISSSSITELNDNRNYSFNEIADYLEDMYRRFYADELTKEAQKLGLDY